MLQHDRTLLLESAARYGTPLYVYSADIIKKKFNALHTALSGTKHRIKFACKSLTNISVLKYMQTLGAELDTVSIQEAKLGLHVGFAPQQIFFTSNSIAFEEIEEAVELGITINVDSIPTLEKFGKKYGSSVPVCIRINPHIMAGGNVKISTGHVDSKFGISYHQFRHVERIVKAYQMRVNGLHQHTGSELKDMNVFFQSADILFQLAQSLPDLEFIDFGGGLKVPYHPDEEGIDVAKFGPLITERFASFCREYGKALEMWFEPGKYLVSESGVLLAKTNVVKQTTATVFAGLNTGLNQLIRPMMYGSYHHIINLSNMDAEEKMYTVVGNVCETDTFATDRMIAEIREEDILCFCNAGAYGHTMSSNYNSRPRPAEVMIVNGELHCIRERETFDDLLRHQIQIF
jgi:diaminopimelate decarboxylase